MGDLRDGWAGRRDTPSEGDRMHINHHWRHACALVFSLALGCDAATAEQPVEAEPSSAAASHPAPKVPEAKAPEVGADARVWPALPEGTTPLPGKIELAAPGLEGVDAYDTIDADAAKAIATAGYVYAARYLLHAENSKANHITRAEAEGILSAGLALILVQEGRGWKTAIPNAELGRHDGKLAVAEAQKLGYPPGAVVFLDVESVRAPGSNAQDVISFATAWHEEVKDVYATGYYVGPSGKLDAAQLGSLPFDHFWKSGTRVPTPAGRGYQLTQHRYAKRGENSVAGVGIDYDITQADARGVQLPWLASLEQRPIP